MEVKTDIRNKKIVIKFEVQSQEVWFTFSPKSNSVLTKL